MPFFYALRAIAVSSIWLFLSAFLWGHATPQFNNAWVVGLFGWMFASLASEMPLFRYANGVLGLWLLVSGWALPVQSTLTIWNSIAVGTFMLAALLGTKQAAPTASSSVGPE
jgi:hypothetical protein